MIQVQKLPVFPEDFTVEYAEGASYWWWSPDKSQPWGLLIGNHDSSDHAVTTGDPVTVFWTSFTEDGPREETECLLEADDVLGMISRVLTEAEVLESSSLPHPLG